VANNTIEMSVDQWINVPDNPRQRDTEKRAKYAVNHHLKESSPQHRFVYAATMNGKILCKVDGHTRALLWKNNKLSRSPDGKVTVNLVPVKSMQEAKDEYDKVDSKKATKSSSDTVFSATRENAFTLESSLLRSCGFKHQLSLIESDELMEDPYALLKKWKPFLLDLDSLRLSATHKVLVGFMLVAIRRDGLATATEFLVNLDKGLGLKDSKGYDGVLALQSYLDSRKVRGYGDLREILKKAWTAYNLFLRGGKVKKDLSDDSSFYDYVNSDLGKSKKKDKGMGQADLHP
jgi:hypothetical protein